MVLGQRRGDPFIIKTNVETFILKSKLSVFALEKVFGKTEVMILERFIFKNFPFSKSTNLSTYSCFITIPTDFWTLSISDYSYLFLKNSATGWFTP